MAARFLVVFAGALVSCLLLFGACWVFAGVGLSADPHGDWLKGFGIAGELLALSVAAAAAVLFWYRPRMGVTVRVYLGVVVLVVVALALLFISPWLTLAAAVAGPFAAFLGTRRFCRAP